MLHRGLLLIAAVIGMTFFVSCSPHSQSTTSSNTKISGVKVDSDPQNETPNGTRTQGTADSGGGNTFQNKPLESYKVKVRELEAYKIIVRPIVETKGIKGTRIGSAIKFILDYKIWYLIPSELKQLSADKIGSAVGSDQAGLQDFKQVWINSSIYEKMLISEQATLIVHEIIMGLKLLKLDSDQNECLAFQFELENKDTQACYNQSSVKVRGKPSDLTQSNYAQIRNATALVVEKGSQLSFQEWEELLGSQGIIELTVKKEISLKELSQMIETSKLMKTWPTYGFDIGKFYSENIDLLKSNPEKLNGKILTSDQACEFDFKITNDHFSLILNDSGKTSTYSSFWTAPIQMNLIKDQFSSFFLYSIGTPTLKTSSQSKKGDEVAFIELKFAGNLLLSVEIRKTVCLNEDCTTSAQGIQGYSQICYTKSTIEFYSPNNK